MDVETMIRMQAPAKINLYLHVVGKRSDGYHDLDSVMVKLGLADEVVLEKRQSGIELCCPGSDLAADESNLAWRAARVIIDYCGISGGVAISLTKKIPLAAGLGGGSSDAAAVIRGICRLYDIHLTRQELLDLGVRLGADVPFFLVDEVAAHAAGIGEKLNPVRFEEVFHVVLVNPGFAVSTKWVFDNFALTTIGNPYILGRESPWCQENAVISRSEITMIFNDLEAVTCSRYPQIASIKERMIQLGALTSLMTGSGPTVFGLFDDRETARRCSEAFSAEPGMSVFLTQVRVDPLAMP